MEELFLTVLNRGIAAGFLVLAAVLLRLLLRRAPKNLRLLLWGFVALRLLLPAAVKSPVGLAPSAQTIPPEAVYAAAPAIDSGIPAVDAAVNPVMAASLSPAPGDSANPLQVWLAVGSVIWLAGLGVMLLYMILSTLLLRRRVADSVPLRENIRLSERIATPFVLGLLRPRIYLPCGMDEETLALVLAHEQGHITRHDHWLKPFGFLLLSVWWFQPLLWLAYVLFCRDLELACDEFVLRLLGERAKKPYARALVSCGAGGHIAACPVAFGEGEVKSRVRAVLRWKPVSRWLLALLIPLCALLPLLFLTDPGLTLSRSAERVEAVEIFDGKTGRALTVTDREQIGRLVALTNGLQLRRGGVSLGYTGYRFRIRFTPAGSAQNGFILNAPDTVRKDPFFYSVQDNGLYAYIEALYEPLVSNPEPAQEQSARPGIDPLALLQSFSDAQILTVYDRTGRGYFPPLRSFEELIAGERWTVNDRLHAFPASDPDRLIELLADGRVLRVEDDGSGDLLYMIYDADWSGEDSVIYLDGGDGLMDELMAWAANGG